MRPHWLIGALDFSETGDVEPEVSMSFRNESPLVATNNTVRVAWIEVTADLR
jgi:hypothetical protein